MADALGPVAGGRDAKCLSKGAIEMALIVKADSVGDLDDRLPATRQQATGPFETQAKQPRVGRHADGPLELLEKREATQPTQTSEIIEGDSLIDVAETIVPDARPLQGG